MRHAFGIGQLSLRATKLVARETIVEVERLGDLPARAVERHRHRRHLHAGRPQGGRPDTENAQLDQASQNLVHIRYVEEGMDKAPESHRSHGSVHCLEMKQLASFGRSRYFAAGLAHIGRQAGHQRAI